MCIKGDEYSIFEDVEHIINYQSLQDLDFSQMEELWIKEGKQQQEEEQ